MKNQIINHNVITEILTLKSQQLEMDPNLSQNKNVRPTPGIPKLPPSKGPKHLTELVFQNWTLSEAK